MTGFGLVCGYALLGATWLNMKTEDITQEWARKCAGYIFGYVAFFMAMVTVSLPLMDDRIMDLWFSQPNIFYLQPFPMLSIVMFVFLWIDLRHKREARPFFLTLGIFLMNYAGIGISTWPWLAPFEITFRRAAAAPESLSLLLVGALLLLPVVLAYTGYCYYVFKGKSSHEISY
jgi:cytochrome bd ubiquinol oxidase subunit II